MPLDRRDRPLRRGERGRRELTHTAVGEHCLLEYSNPDLAAAREHRDVVLGIKVREQIEVVGAHGLEPLRRGIRAADLAGLPVIVHVNNPPAEYGEVLAMLRPGDIVSHFFHGRGSGILRPDAAGNGWRRARPAHHAVKVLSLGMPLDTVVRAATAAPGRAIGRSGELGTLAVGAAGDAAVVSVDEGAFDYQDADGNSFQGARRWTPRLTVRAGRVWWRAA